MKAEIRNTSNKSLRNTSTRTAPSRDTSKTNPRSTSKKPFVSDPQFLFYLLQNYIDVLKEDGVDHMPVIKSLENILFDGAIGPDGKHLPPREASMPWRPPVYEPEPTFHDAGLNFEGELEVVF